MGPVHHARTTPSCRGYDRWYWVKVDRAEIMNRKGGKSRSRSKRIEIAAVGMTFHPRSGPHFRHVLLIGTVRLKHVCVPDLSTMNAKSAQSCNCNRPTMAADDRSFRGVVLPNAIHHALRASERLMFLANRTVARIVLTLYKNCGFLYKQPRCRSVQNYLFFPERQ
jgi:hypothetical protein